MAFSPKTDFVGLTNAITSGLELRSNSTNDSQTVLQIPGSDGSIIGDEKTGLIKNPSCEYVFTDICTITEIILGKVYSTIQNMGPFALQHIHISTGAGQEPVLTADAVQIEANAEQTWCTYDISSSIASSYTPARHAITFGAFTYSQAFTPGTDCSADTVLALQTCELDAQATIDPSTINNVPKASDATAGIITVTPTFWTNSDTTPPTVTITNGWSLTSPWTCTGADSSMFVWTCTLSKYLTATEPTP